MKKIFFNYESSHHSFVVCVCPPRQQTDGWWETELIDTVEIASVQCWTDGWWETELIDTVEIASVQCWFISYVT